MFQTGSSLRFSPEQRIFCPRMLFSRHIQEILTLSRLAWLYGPGSDIDILEEALPTHGHPTRKLGTNR